MPNAETIAKVMQDMSAEAATIIEDMTFDLALEAALYRAKLRGESVDIQHPVIESADAKPDYSSSRLIQEMDSKTARALRQAGSLSSSHGFIL